MNPFHRPRDRRPAAALLAPHAARRDRHRRPAAPARAHALVIGAGGLGSPVALYLGTAGVGHADPRRPRHRRPDQPAAADRPRPVARGPAERPNRQRRRIAASTPVEVRAGPGTRRRRLARRAGARRRRGARLQRQLPHPPCRQRRLRGAPQAAGVGRGHRLRRPDLGLRLAQRHEPLLRLPVPARPAPSRRCAAPRWACSRRWSASSAACRPPRR
jgi:hypothetical protein